MYRSEAATAAGFVQQLACSYLANGYHYYVVGEVPERKAPEEVDRKLVERYGLGSSKWVRARRKKAGLANVNYIRFRRFFVLCATAGRHDFFTAHAGQVRRIHEPRSLLAATPSATTAGSMARGTSQCASIRRGIGT